MNSRSIFKALFRTRQYRHPGKAKGFLVTALAATTFNLCLSTSADTNTYNSTNLSTPLLPAPAVSTDALDSDALYYKQNSDLLNEQWLRQHQAGIVESDSLGKLLQLGFKATYKSFRDRGAISRKMPNENGDGKISSVAEMKYKVRLKSDAVKFGLEYRF